MKLAYGFEFSKELNIVRIFNTPSFHLFARAQICFVKLFSYEQRKKQNARQQQPSYYFWIRHFTNNITIAILNIIQHIRINSIRMRIRLKFHWVVFCVCVLFWLFWNSFDNARNIVIYKTLSERIFFCYMSFMLWFVIFLAVFTRNLHWTSCGLYRLEIRWNPATTVKIAINKSEEENEIITKHGMYKVKFSWMKIWIETTTFLKWKHCLFNLFDKR